MSNSLQSHGLQPTRLLHPWNFPGKSTGVGCHFLLHFHIQSYIITVIDLIWNCISAFYHRLSHTFGKVRNSLLKQATQKIIQLAIISKVTSKNLNTELSLGIAQYTPGHLNQLNGYSQVFISWLYIMEHLTFIQRLVTEISFRNNFSVLFNNLIKHFSNIT